MNEISVHQMQEGTLDELNTAEFPSEVPDSDSYVARRFSMQRFAQALGVRVLIRGEAEPTESQVVRGQRLLYIKTDPPRRIYFHSGVRDEDWIAITSVVDESYLTIAGAVSEIPSNPYTKQKLLFDADIADLPNAVDTNGVTAKTSAHAFDLFEFNGTTWQYIGFIGDTDTQDGVVTSLLLDIDDSLLVDRSIGARLVVNLSRLRHTDLLSLGQIENENDLTISVGENHAQTYGDRDQYEFRSTFGDGFTNTGPVRLRIRYSQGGSLIYLDYKDVLDIHGLPLIAGVMQRGELISVRFDTELDAWISNIYPVVDANHPGLMSVSQFHKLNRAVPSFDALPDAANYDNGQVIFVDGRFYENRRSPAANAFAGIIGEGLWEGETLRGVDPRVGRWTSNPQNAASWFAVESDQLLFNIEQSAYRTAKGSNEADGDTLQLRLTVTGTTEDITVNIRPGNARLVRYGGKTYVNFDATVPETNLLLASDVGDAFTLFIRRNNADFITHEAELPHWIRVSVQDYIRDESLSAEITTLLARTGIGVGSTLPDSPYDNELWLFDAAVTGLTGAVDTNGTTAKTSAQALDLFRFDGTNWRYVGFLGDTDTTQIPEGTITEAMLSEAVRALLARTGIGVGNTLPDSPYDNELWLFDAAVTGLTGAVDTNGTTAKTSAQALDLFRYDGTNWRYVGFLGDTNTETPGEGGTGLTTAQSNKLDRAVPSFDALPNAGNYSDGQVILVLSKFYRHYTTQTANTLSGEIGRVQIDNETISGTRAGDVADSALGQWISNPNRVVSSLIDDSRENSVSIAIERQAYRTAKGSNEADGDQLVLRLTVGDTTQDFTVTLVDETRETDDGLTYLLFEGASPSNSVLRTASVGDAFTLLIRRNNADFITFAAALSHWNRYPLISERQHALPEVYVFDRLPQAADYANRQVILVDGRLYRNANTPVANAFAGIIGEGVWAGGTLRGVDTSIGRWTINPQNAASYFTVEDGQLLFNIEQSAYRAAKGGNEANGDTLQLRLTVGDTTQDITVTIRSTDGPAAQTVRYNGKTYVNFDATVPSNNLLRTASVGSAFTLLIRRNNADFITHEADLAHWVLYPIRDDHLESIVSAEIEKLQDEKVSSDTIDEIVTLTQAEYSALTSKDSSTFYVIVG